jgi:hypothetical protein
MSNTGGTSEQTPDIGAILESLRNEIRAQRLARGRAEPSAAESELARALDDIELHRVVSAHWPLIGNSLPQRVIALFNKIVRRYLRWYINPIVEQQNAYNDTVARTLRLLADAYTELAEQVAELETQQQQQPPNTPSDTTPKAASDASQAQLMDQVRAMAQAEPAARFPDLELAKQTPYLAVHEQVNAHWHLGGNTLPQKVVAQINKLVRRYLRWLINPIVEQQNAANSAFRHALLRVVAVDAEHRADVAALRARR